MRDWTFGLLAAVALGPWQASQAAEGTGKPAFASDAVRGPATLVLKGRPQGRVRISALNQDGGELECSDAEFFRPSDGNDPRGRGSVWMTITGEPKTGEVSLSIQKIPGQPPVQVTAREIHVNTRTMEFWVQRPATP